MLLMFNYKLCCYCCTFCGSHCRLLRCFLLLIPLWLYGFFKVFGLFVTMYRVGLQLQSEVLFATSLFVCNYSLKWRRRSTTHTTQLVWSTWLHSHLVASLSCMLHCYKLDKDGRVSKRASISQVLVYIGAE